MSFFLYVIGMVFVIEGLPYFAFPDKMKRLTQNIPRLPNTVLRALGIVATMLGLLIMYIAKSLVKTG